MTARESHLARRADARRGALAGIARSGSKDLASTAPRASPLAPRCYSIVILIVIALPIDVYMYFYVECSSDPIGRGCVIFSTAHVAAVCALRKNVFQGEPALRVKKFGKMKV